MKDAIYTTELNVGDLVRPYWYKTTRECNVIGIIVRKEYSDNRRRNKIYVYWFGSNKYRKGFQIEYKTSLKKIIYEEDK